VSKSKLKSKGVVADEALGGEVVQDAGDLGLPAKVAQDKAVNSVKELDPAIVGKFHSALRWQKSPAELETIVREAGLTMSEIVGAKDAKTGNQSLHIAAQNGHQELVELLVKQKADVNCQNLKGQTPLHMSVKYDMFFVSKFFLDNGADPTRKNQEGHQAILGLDGDKCGADAWNAPVTVLKSAKDDAAELSIAFEALEKADAASMDKAALAQAGMAKKKECTQNWDQARFMALMKKL